MLCSSRGISWAWLDRVAPGWHPENVAQELNELFKSDPSKFAYYGKSEGDFQYYELGLVFESPFYLRSKSLQFGDGYSDGRISNRYIQVYSGDQVTVYEGRKYEDNQSQQFQERYYNVNALQSYPGGYLVLEMGKFIPKTIQGEEYHRLFRPRENFLLFPQCSFDLANLRSQTNHEDRINCILGRWLRNLDY